MGGSSEEEFLDSDTQTGDDDSEEEDPSFDITQSKLSKLSITASRVPPDVNADDDDRIETELINATDQKSFEFVQNIIQAGQVEKLKVEQCKLYLRKHGLRLSGKKDVLIHRINDHISIMNGEGEHKYPASSFVMNCKGDACTGDIVMFEQNVYEMFSVASRSATGPPCGTRVVAGRIVKESYGAAKQQHTFTIEVLWSKGEKPFPPLHPLLIKGRNLYRLKTMRQRWEDESQRRKILSEKHSRGDAARLNREARLQEKEKKKALKEYRASKGNIRIEKDEKKTKTSPIHTMINSENPRKPDLQNISIQHRGAPYKGVLGSRSLKNNARNNHGDIHKENITPNDLRSPVRREPHSPFRRSFQVEQNINHNDFRSPVRREPHSPFRKSFQVEQNIVSNGFRSPVRQEPPSPFRRSFQFEQDIIPNDFRSAVRGEPHSPSRKCFQVEQDISFRSPVRREPNSPLRRSFQVEQFRSPVRGEPRSPFRRSFQVEQDIIPNDLRCPVRGEPHSPLRKSFQAEQSMGVCPSKVFERHDYDHRANIHLTRNPRESYDFHQGNNHHRLPRGRYQGQRQQLCRYYSQGRCRYGTNCKYLH